MYCKKCGKQIPAGEDFCPRCGSCQENYHRPEYYGRRKRSDKRNLVVPVTVVIGSVVLIAGISIYFCMHGKKKETVQPSSEATTEISSSEYPSEDPDLASVTDAELTPAEQYAALQEDVSAALAIQTAIETELYFGSPDQMAALEQMKGCPAVLLSDALILQDPTGVYQAIKDSLGGSYPEIRYSGNGASGFSFRIAEDGSVHVYITDGSTIDRWEICPNVCPEYDTSW